MGLELPGEVDVSGPFSSSGGLNRPAWGVISTVGGNFQPLLVTGGTNIPEVGYGEGGYGEGGYDTPSINIPAAPTTQWTVEDIK